MANCQKSSRKATSVNGSAACSNGNNPRIDNAANNSSPGDAFDGGASNAPNVGSSSSTAPSTPLSPQIGPRAATAIGNSFDLPMPPPSPSSSLEVNISDASEDEGTES